MSVCNLCPRHCSADRDGAVRGVCGESNKIRVARIAPHFFEEPVLSGTNGSGAVFFCGCPLHCVYCQNKDISVRGGIGEEIDSEELYRRITKLASTGVHNINLVSASHFLNSIIPVLERLKREGFSLPIVYNSSGYESVHTLERLCGLIDIYLPDFKYASSELAQKYSSAPDYPEIAQAAICEMHRQVGKPMYGKDGMLVRGMIVRHLVLPSHRLDSIEVLYILSRLLPTDSFLISLMSQYTPEFALDSSYNNLHRRITSFEYSSVCDAAEKLGFEGFVQEKSSASSEFTPDFGQKS